MYLVSPIMIHHGRFSSTVGIVSVVVGSSTTAAAHTAAVVHRVDECYARGHGIEGRYATHGQIQAPGHGKGSVLGLHATAAASTVPVSHATALSSGQVCSSVKTTLTA